MSMLLQELFRQEIGFRGQEESEQYRKKLRKLVVHQDAFREQLSKQAESGCMKIWEEMNEIGADTCERMYIQGLRTGARLLMALLEEEVPKTGA